MMCHFLNCLLGIDIVLHPSYVWHKFKPHHMDFDTDFWSEIQDAPGEIFDIPEMQDHVLDFNQALNSDEDF